ncbi:MAG TPA: TetR/AcrR family transcriptional regulator [Mycobacteriales bacterium]|jgi:AcrR family transcriptional regulator|nr:TetR/AcrR family transcriptional regulator [Mycobacteriales bacterium]
MPRFVDHAARRDLVARAAADLAADEGLDALTVRRVAQAAGFSTTVVSHYFTDRRDLMVATYRAAAARSSERFDAALVAATTPLQACLEALLPLDAERRRDWRIWFAFWAMALADEQLAQEQVARVRSARGRVTAVLELEQAQGRVRPGLDLPDVAYGLLVLVHGLGTQAVFDGGHWTPARQRGAVRAELARLLPEP